MQFILVFYIRNMFFMDLNAIPALLILRGVAVICNWVEAVKTALFLAIFYSFPLSGIVF